MEHLQHLCYIIEIARTGSVSDTAKSFDCSQTTIRNCLNKIAQEYDIELFQKQGKALIPTQKCQNLISIGKELLKTVRAFDAQFPNAVCAAKHLAQKDFVRFITVANEASFTKAASKLYITQPAISQTIQKIEQNYNIQLFLRENSQKVILTNDGRQFYHFSVKFIEALDAITAELSS